MIKKVTIILLVMLSLSILALYGLNPSALLSNSFLWLTLFIVPWIILYWLVRLTKTLEKKEWQQTSKCLCRESWFTMRDTLMQTFRGCPKGEFCPLDHPLGVWGCRGSWSIKPWNKKRTATREKVSAARSFSSFKWLLNGFNFMGMFNAWNKNTDFRGRKFEG